MFQPFLSFPLPRNKALSLPKPEYDMDEEDFEWLETFNTQQALENKPHLSEDDFERVFDQFEKEYYTIEKEKMEESRLEGNVESLGILTLLGRFLLGFMLIF